MTNPLVTVVMCARNEEAYIADAVRSILQQTWRHFELIVIDDYSTDHTLDVCKSLRDPRIRTYSKVREPIGLAASKNIGTRLASGDYIAYQDADDLAMPTRIERLLQESLKSPGRRIVSSWVEKIVGQKAIIFRPPTAHRAIVRGFNRTVNRCTFVSGAMMLPTSVAYRIQNRTDLKYQEDWDHLARLYESGEVEFVNVPEVLYRYFIRQKSSYMKPDWLAYNIFVRALSRRRRSGLPEWTNIEEFHRYLEYHPIDNVRWKILAKLIAVNAQLKLAGLHRGADGAA